MLDYFSIKFMNGKLCFLDQTKLPDVEEFICTDSPERIALAIERLEIRGAPLIAIAALYGVALAVKASEKNFYPAIERFKSTRPTAVNLFNELRDLERFFEEDIKNQNYEAVLNFAFNYHKKDERYCENISKIGADYIENLFNRKLNIITHCNTGALATGGMGTAFGVIYELHRRNLVNMVFACETRPFLQGLRLTSFELKKNKINHVIIVDSLASFIMKKEKIDLVIVGADRIAKNGDTANKVGTYSLAINARYHNILFFVAAPSTTFDNEIQEGENIKIEERSPDELLSFGSSKVLFNQINSINYSFDVTPSDLISGIITEKKVYTPPFDFSYV